MKTIYIIKHCNKRKIIKTIYKNLDKIMASLVLSLGEKKDLIIA